MMEVKKSYVMANKLHSWSDLKIGDISVPIETGSVGFIQVFRSVEELKKELGSDQAYTEIDCSVDIEEDREATQ